MNKDYTHITVVLDRSGSMQRCWKETVGGLEGLIKNQKTNKEQCTLSLYSFDNTVERPVEFTDIQILSESVEDLKIYPRGSTALYDAIGQAIVETGEKLASLPEKERPARIIFVITTDGEENSSVEYSSSRVKDLIKTQTEKYSWDFMFLGASEHSILNAKEIGIDISNISRYNVSKTTKTFDTMSTKLNSVRSASFDSYKSTLAFTEIEKSAMVD